MHSYIIPAPSLHRQNATYSKNSRVQHPPHHLSLSSDQLPFFSSQSALFSIPSIRQASPYFLPPRSADRSTECYRDALLPLRHSPPHIDNIHGNNLEAKNSRSRLAQSLDVSREERRKQKKKKKKKESWLFMKSLAVKRPQEPSVLVVTNVYVCVCLFSNVCACVLLNTYCTTHAVDGTYAYMSKKAVSPHCLLLW